MKPYLPAYALLALVSAAVATIPSLSHATEDFECLLTPHSEVLVSAVVPGLVTEIGVQRGQVVREGDVLFQLDDSLERADLAIARLTAENDQLVAAARTQANFARLAADRLLALREENPAALNQAQLDEALSRAQVAEFTLLDAETNQARARLAAMRAEALVDQKQVRSPIDGVVVERLMSEGEFRNDQAAVLRLAGLDPLYVEAFLPATLYGQIQLGDDATITLEGQFAGPHLAKVVVIDPIIDPASRTFGLRWELPNPGSAIPAGLRCRVTVSED